MKNWRNILLICLLIILSGCNGNKAEEVSLKPVEVDLQTPEHVHVNEPFTVRAVVTQKGEEVADADEVMFEVWKAGDKENSQSLDVMKQNGGKYEIETSFSEVGEYFVQVHVTARRMHVMPKEKIHVEERADSIDNHDISE
ncbi:FixH family protein [Bacillus andreraoultii]|uniref:FixH family protein n=1 Tax=Bacillus andreraoultii TaxID=1499685 RepID=UPI00053B9CE2|nr:FixH family protein [Bacillus andreraoultii]